MQSTLSPRFVAVGLIQLKRTAKKFCAKVDYLDFIRSNEVFNDLDGLGLKISGKCIANLKQNSIRGYQRPFIESRSEFYRLVMILVILVN
jgi:hypothetical protein